MNHLDKKRLTVIKVSDDMEKLECPHITGGLTSYSRFRKHLVIYTKFEICVTDDPEIHSQDINKKKYSHALYLNTFTTTIILIALISTFIQKKKNF